MAAKKLEPQHDDHINVTPLIDIVMCLIIFFMVCGKMAQEESSGELTIPKASHAKELEDQKNRLIVNIEPDLPPGADMKDASAKKAATSARFVIRGKKVSEDQVVGMLREEKAKNADMRLLIRADRNLPYPLISPLIVACARAEIGSMHFATEFEEPLK